MPSSCKDIRKYCSFVWRCRAIESRTACTCWPFSPRDLEAAFLFKNEYCGSLTEQPVQGERSRNVSRSPTALWCSEILHRIAFALHYPTSCQRDANNYGKVLRNASMSLSLTLSILSYTRNYSLIPIDISPQTRHGRHAETLPW